MADVEDYSDEIKKALRDKLEAALEAIGIQAESHAKSNITKAGRVDTGNLRNSVTHTVKEDTVYIGTSSEYAV